MKCITHIILFLISFNAVAQNFADKKYYLVDSLVIEDLTSQDKHLLDSCLKIYHSTNMDTTKVQILSCLIDPMISESWKKYQYYQYKIILSALESNPSNKELLAIRKCLGDALSNIGFICSGQGRITEALDYYNRAYKIYEELDDKVGLALSLNNTGSIYSDQGQMKEALDCNMRSLELREKIGDKGDIANSLHNLASIYDENGQEEKALDYYGRSMKIFEELGDKKGLAHSLNNIGYIYKRNGKLKKALGYYNRSLKIREEIGSKEGIAFSTNNIAILYKKNGQFKKSLAYSLKSLAIAQEIGSAISIQHSSSLLSDLYEGQGNFTKALEMYKLQIKMKDSLSNKATQKAAAQQQAKYAYDKQKTIDDAVHEKQKAIDSAEYDKLIAIEQEKKEKQQIVSGAISIGLGLLAIFLIFVLNRLKVTRRQKNVIEGQKVIVERQKELADQAHDELEEKNQEIMDSINYAKRIQSAILPPAKLIKKYLKESFILYKPKDVVAGDFYWMEQTQDKVLFAAADCTGHGVPGAMVSVVCNNALNRSVREHGLSSPGEILGKTREIVVQEFDQSDEDVNDGMDIALCSVEGMKLEYAGAHNPLWIIRNGEIIETKANKQPVGQFDNPKPFTTHKFDLEKGDTIYIFSDGYVDQFGGEKGKKFKSKTFRQLLLSMQDKTMKEQCISINKAFETWRGDLEQIDDVCVIGVRFSS